MTSKILAPALMSLQSGGREQLRLPREAKPEQALRCVFENRGKRRGESIPGRGNRLYIGLDTGGSRTGCLHRRETRAVARKTAALGVQSSQLLP